jgi:phage gp16-like protein
MPKPNSRQSAPRPGSQSSARRRNLARLHIAKKDLALDESTYREMLLNLTGKGSSADFSPDDFRRIFAHLNGCGWKARRKGQPKEKDMSAQMGKIKALLTQGKLSWAYAHAIAKQMYGVDKLQWCNAAQLQAVITALVKKIEKAPANKHRP